MRQRLNLTSEIKRCLKREVGLGSHSLSHSSSVPNKPYGFCGRKAPWKEKKLTCSFSGVRLTGAVMAMPLRHSTVLSWASNVAVSPAYRTASTSFHWISACVCVWERQTGRKRCSDKDRNSERDGLGQQRHGQLYCLHNVRMGNQNFRVITWHNTQCS